jgi:bifunctional ADP-heptose synthase (sugar kinase/adenylyltransferase)
MGVLSRSKARRWALTRLRPDIYVRGGDYSAGQIPESTAVHS